MSIYDSYEDRKEKEQKDKLDKLLCELPLFCHTFLEEGDMSVASKVAYARDLIIFFEFYFAGEGVDLNRDDPKLLEDITTKDIEAFERHLVYYKKDGVVHENTERGIKRKESVIRAMFWFFYEKGQINAAPDCFDMAKAKFRRKQHKIDNVKEHEETLQSAIDLVASGALLQGKESIYANKTHKRDMAIIQVLCDTGAALSCIVALNCEDIDFTNKSITIREKKATKKIKLSDEALSVLNEYLIERNGIENKSMDGNALFLSMQKTRMTGRAIEIMLKKYCDEGARPRDFRKARKTINIVHNI